MKIMTSTQILVLDDLGSEPLDRLGYTASALFEVVDCRWGKRLKTILTTNLNPKQFRGRYGRKATDRIAQGGRVVIVRGKSMRVSS